MKTKIFILQEQLRERGDYDPSANVLLLDFNGERDVFIQKNDSAGNLLWANSVGGDGLDVASSITLNSLNEVYVSGTFEGTVNFDSNNPTSTVMAVGGSSSFVLKFDEIGNQNVIIYF